MLVLNTASFYLLVSTFWHWRPTPSLSVPFCLWFGVSPVSFLFLSFVSVHLLPLNPLYSDVPQLTDLSFEDVRDSSISLRWSPLNITAITGYRITVMAAGESVPIFEDMVMPTTGHYTVYGLEPGIDYDISVITVSENGESKPTTITQQTCKLHVQKDQNNFLTVNIISTLFSSGHVINFSCQNCLSLCVLCCLRESHESHFVITQILRCNMVPINSKTKQTF